MDASEQALLAQILDLFAERFDKKAVLRLLGCPRFTNDLDYVTDRDVAEALADCLPPENWPGLPWPSGRNWPACGKGVERGPKCFFGGRSCCSSTAENILRGEKVEIVSGTEEVWE